ncbi:MAG TPA: type II secretion system protein GspM [Geminicoccaceae bacterium]|nr:type II secretion system protein GspM [Geminicoccus sp.]HMU50070.1 type II secretion system protein GspM [Geminicoccaceae bacterium]
MRRALAVAILIVLVLAIGGLVWLPFGILHGQDAEIVHLGERMRELEARLRGREQLLAEQRLLERASQADQTLAQADTPALAGAELQRVLTELVAAGGGALESVQVLEPVQRLPFVQISIRLSFTSTIEALRQFLYAVERHAPVLLVHDLSVTEAATYDSQGEPLPSQLYSTVEIQAFTRAQAPS